LPYTAQNNIVDLKTPPHSIEAEQSVLGGLMLVRMISTVKIIV
jgi:hypothetical protein